MATMDPNQAAYARVQAIIDKTEGKNPAAVALGRRGGLKGGKARSESMTPERRREIAKKASRSRWFMNGGNSQEK